MVHPASVPDPALPSPREPHQLELVPGVHPAVAVRHHPHHVGRHRNHPAPADNLLPALRVLRGRHSAEDRVPDCGLPEARVQLDSAVRDDGPGVVPARHADRVHGHEPAAQTALDRIEQEQPANGGRRRGLVLVLGVREAAIDGVSLRASEPTGRDPACMRDGLTENGRDVIGFLRFVSRL